MDDLSLIQKPESTDQVMSDWLLSHLQRIDDKSESYKVLHGWRNNVLPANVDHEGIVTIPLDSLSWEINVGGYLNSRAQPGVLFPLLKAKEFIKESSEQLTLFEEQVHAGVYVDFDDHVKIQNIDFFLDAHVNSLGEWYADRVSMAPPDLKKVITEEFAAVQRELSRLKKNIKGLKRRISVAAYTIDIRSSYRKKTHGVFKNLDDEDAIV